MQYLTYNIHNFREIPQISQLSFEEQQEIDIVGQVFPFKTNSFIVNELINWKNFKDDPMFLLNFPQREMLEEKDYESVKRLVQDGESKKLYLFIQSIHKKIKPTLLSKNNNQPSFNGNILEGVQHKYNETVLFFPSEGSDCFAYCTFCFRWDQFMPRYYKQFNSQSIDLLVDYIQNHVEITDLLITGGDPLTMTPTILSSYIDKIIAAKITHLTTIRIGTRALTYWPYIFTIDGDANELLIVFKKIINNGMSLKIMAHINHYNELENSKIVEAINKIKSIGAMIYTQSPILKHINDSPDIWIKMWNMQVKLGMVPYYMFVLRNYTGSKDFFKISLGDGLRIFREAYTQVSGIARTVKGPVMSCNIGKVRIVGITEFNNEKYFILDFIQSPNCSSIKNPVLVRYNAQATWIDDLNLSNLKNC